MILKSDTTVTLPKKPYTVCIYAVPKCVANQFKIRYKLLFLIFFVAESNLLQSLTTTAKGLPCFCCCGFILYRWHYFFLCLVPICTAFFGLSFGREPASPLAVRPPLMRRRLPLTSILGSSPNPLSFKEVIF